MTLQVILRADHNVGTIESRPHVFLWWVKCQKGFLFAGEVFKTRDITENHTKCPKNGIACSRGARNRRTKPDGREIYSLAPKCSGASLFSSKVSFLHPLPLSLPHLQVQYLQAERYSILWKVQNLFVYLAGEADSGLTMKRHRLKRWVFLKSPTTCVRSIFENPEQDERIVAGVILVQNYECCVMGEENTSAGEWSNEKMSSHICDHFIFY